MSTEAMKRAREALGLYARTLAPTETQKKGMEALTALDEALAQPQQEPVAWMHEWEDGEKIPMLKGRDDRNQDKPKTVRPLVYGDTSPQPAQPQQEPVAWALYQRNILLSFWMDKGDAYDFEFTSEHRWEPLYTSPPAQEFVLTAREIELLDGMIEVQLDHAARCDNIANRVMAEKQKGWDMERVELLRKLKGDA